MEIYCAPDSFVTTISEFPRAADSHRRSARSSKTVTNRRHAPVLLDEVSINVLRSISMANMTERRYEESWRKP